MEQRGVKNSKIDHLSFYFTMPGRLVMTFPLLLISAIEELLDLHSHVFTVVLAGLNFTDNFTLVPDTTLFGLFEEMEAKAQIVYIQLL